MHSKVRAQGTGQRKEEVGSYRDGIFQKDELATY